MQRTYNIEIDCPNCALKVEEALKNLKGVNEVSINFMKLKMFIDIDDANFDNVLKQAIKVAKKIEPDFEILD